MTCSHGKECPCARESNELRAEVDNLETDRVMARSVLDSSEAEIDKLRAEVSRLNEAGKRLAETSGNYKTAVDSTKEPLRGAIEVAAIHGYAYKGPNFFEEGEYLVAALAAIPKGWREL